MGAGVLPSGNVTFVLTDIEGSTRLLRRLEDRYSDVLERHVELVRQAWEEQGGVLLSARGDSCFGAFADSPAALAACAEAQRRLAAEAWPPEGGPRVRMGVHSGLASPRDGDYVALAVHQAARVMAAAHGGQVLVSDVTAAEIGPLPGLELRAVGRYRLRDFDDPVPLFCLAGPGLEVDFPAVRAMPVDGHNLAGPATSLVGRDIDIVEVTELVGAGRLVTLTGPGGVGKSRLAVAVGRTVAPLWGDGVWLVDVSPMHDARLIGTAVADVLGVPAGGANDAWEATLEHLHERRALLVLDNCEHLAAEVATLVTELLDRCPGMAALATSREPLGIGREVLWRVRPLGLPAAGATVADALASPATRLFVERATAARPDFTITDDDVPAVVELCDRLDGLPLAIELAAAQVSLLRVAEILQGLDDHDRVLRSRQRSVPRRQRTMDAVMDWSYRLLSPDEQAVLRRLSVFRGGFSIGAAGVAGEDLEGIDALEVLWALVDKSLVAVDTMANDTRYRQLQTVRSYARRLADAEGEAVPTAVRLAAWWLDRIGPWHPMDRVRSGEMEVELDNLRAIVPLVSARDEQRAQLLACSIAQHYYAVQAPRAATSELARYADQLPTPSPALLSLLATLALLHVHHGDFGSAQLVLARADDVQRAGASPPPWDEVAIERARGEIAIRSGDHAGAAAIARQALERQLAPRARGRMLNLLAIASYFAGDVAAADAAFREELDIARRVGDEHLLVVAEGNVAELAVRMGDVSGGARHQAACLELALALGRPVSVAQSLILAARLVADTDPALAARLHSKAEAVLGEKGHRLYDDDLRASEEMMAQVRDKLGDDDFRQACDSGRALSVPESASLAQGALAALPA